MPSDEAWSPVPPATVTQAAVLFPMALVPRGLFGRLQRVLHERSQVAGRLFFRDDTVVLMRDPQQHRVRVQCVPERGGIMLTVRGAAALSYIDPLAQELTRLLDSVTPQWLCPVCVCYNRFWPAMLPNEFVSAVQADSDACAVDCQFGHTVTLSGMQSGHAGKVDRNQAVAAQGPRHLVILPDERGFDLWQLEWWARSSKLRLYVLCDHPTGCHFVRDSVGIPISKPLKLVEKYGKRIGATLRALELLSKAAQKIPDPHVQAVAGAVVPVLGGMAKILDRLGKDPALKFDELRKLMDVSGVPEETDGLDASAQQQLAKYLRIAEGEDVYKGLEPVMEDSGFVRWMCQEHASQTKRATQATASRDERPVMPQATVPAKLDNAVPLETTQTHSLSRESPPLPPSISSKAVVPPSSSTPPSHPRDPALSAPNTATDDTVVCRFVCPSVGIDAPVCASVEADFTKVECLDLLADLLGVPVERIVRVVNRAGVTVLVPRAILKHPEDLYTVILK